MGNCVHAHVLFGSFLLQAHREMKDYKEAVLELYEQVVAEDIQREVDQQLAVVRNPLEWWRLHERRFPLLAKGARACLCVPASSAPVERLFSSARVVGERRYSLKSEHLEALVMYHQNNVLDNPLKLLMDVNVTKSKAPAAVKSAGQTKGATDASNAAAIIQ